MTHHHLALELFYGFKRNTDHNDNGRATQGQVNLLVEQSRNLREQNREQRDNRNQQSAKQCNS